MAPPSRRNRARTGPSFGSSSIIQPSEAFLAQVESIEKPRGALPPTEAEYLANRGLTTQVIEYLVKKGYNRTEQMLRLESLNLDKDGKPILDRAEDLGTAKYARGFRMLSKWIDGNLDVYKVSLPPLRH